MKFCIQLTFILFNLCLHPKQANITQTLILFPSETEMRYLLIVIFIQLNQTEHNFALPGCDGRCKQKITSVVKFPLQINLRYGSLIDTIPMMMLSHE